MRQLLFKEFVAASSEFDQLFANFVIGAFSYGFPFEFIRTAVRGDAFPSPYSQTGADIVGGAYQERSSDGVFANFLLLCDRTTGKQFIIMQRIDFIAGVIFLDEDLLIRSSKSNDDTKAFGLDVESFPDVSNLPSTPSKFKGVVFGSHGRPYHQIFDQLPLFVWSFNHTAAPLWMHKKRSFFHVEDFPKANWFAGATSDDWQAEFYILSSLAYKHADYDRGLFEAAVDAVQLASKRRASLSESAEEFRAWRQRHDPVVWVGVCDMKARWADSQETVLRSISKLKERYPRAGFVFDGMTCTASANAKSYQAKECASELSMMHNITKATGTADSFYSVIGEKAITKDFVAGEVDFFIANAATDSVWPAGFNRKRGLVHCANKARAEVAKMYMHRKSLAIPAKHVKDLDDGKLFHWTKYSIDPDYFADLASQALTDSLKSAPAGKLVKRTGFSSNEYVVALSDEEPYIFAADVGLYHINVDAFVSKSKEIEVSVIGSEGALLKTYQLVSGLTSVTFDVPSPQNLQVVLRIDGAACKFFGVYICQME